MKQENRSVNFLKGIACILVVLNHIHWDGIFGEVIYCLSHMGVPIFFLVSGYYLIREKKLDFLSLKRKINHIIELLFLHISLYIIDFLIETIIMRGNSICKDDVLMDIFNIFSVSALKSSLLYSTSIYGAGQWFLIALIECYVIFFLLSKLKIIEFIQRYGMVIAIFLFVIHIPIRLMLISTGVNIFFGARIYESYSVRNAWFDGLPFMLIGLSIRYYEQRIKFDKLIVPLRCILVLSGFTSIFEMFFCKSYFGTRIQCVLYVGTIVSVVIAFIISIGYPSGNKHRWFKLVADLGKNLSMTVYFIHVIIANWLKYIFFRGGYPIMKPSFQSS